ncbi:MAG: hypothetical protein EBY54_01330 [Proteobacteria bacterium]|nr:hypothetical protein [Pseudomonadota bacterium]
MIKKIYILVFISILICSCGKKGDPVYKEENQNEAPISFMISLALCFHTFGNKPCTKHTNDKLHARRRC